MEEECYLIFSHLFPKFIKVLRVSSTILVWPHKMTVQLPPIMLFSSLVRELSLHGGSVFFFDKAITTLVKTVRLELMDFASCIVRPSTPVFSLKTYLKEVIHPRQKKLANPASSLLCTTISWRLDCCLFNDQLKSETHCRQRFEVSPSIVCQSSLLSAFFFFIGPTLEVLWINRCPSVCSPVRLSVTSFSRDGLISFCWL